MLLIILNLKKKKEGIPLAGVLGTCVGREVSGIGNEGEDPPTACLCLWNSGCVHAFAYFKKVFN